MKVLLISANMMKQPYPVYPVGLDFVIQAISPPHDVKSVDMNELKSGAALASVVADYGPDVIGISIRNIDNVDDTQAASFIGQMSSLIDMIRLHSEAIIVLGGSGFTILPAECMAALDADFGIIGEGERFPELLQALERNAPVSGIPGIVMPKGAIAIPDPLTATFRRNAIPDHSYTDFYLKRGGMLNVQTKRGCPFSCIYCTYPNIEGRDFRFAEPEGVARTARMLQDAGAKYLYITDSTFNGHYGHSLAVAAAFKKAGISVPWGGFFTPTAPPPDYYRKLADAGLMHVEFGTEALADPMLASYGKPFRTPDVIASHGQAIAAGLHVAHYLMFGGPGENDGTLCHTLVKSDRLEKTAFFVFCGVRIYPRTILYEQALREGQIQPGVNLLDPVFYWSPSLQREKVMAYLTDHAARHPNWIIGTGPPHMYRMMARLYTRGHVGPLWEYLVR